GEAAFPSVAKQGWRGHQVDVRVRLEAQPGMSGAIVRPIGRNKEEWLVQPPIIGGLTQPPRLRPLRRLRGIFLMGAATPPCPRRGLRLSLQLFSMPPCPAKDVGHGKPWQRRGRRAINKYPRSFVRRGRGGSFKLQNNSLERTTRLRPKGGFATFS